MILEMQVWEVEPRGWHWQALSECLGMNLAWLVVNERDQLDCSNRSGADRCLSLIRLRPACRSLCQWYIPALLKNIEKGRLEVLVGFGNHMMMLLQHSTSCTHCMRVPQLLLHYSRAGGLQHTSSVIIEVLDILHIHC